MVFEGVRPRPIAAEHSPTLEVTPHVLPADNIMIVDDVRHAGCHVHRRCDATLRSVSRQPDWALD